MCKFQYHRGWTCRSLQYRFLLLVVGWCILHMYTDSSYGRNCFSENMAELIWLAESKESSSFTLIVTSLSDDWEWMMHDLRVGDPCRLLSFRTNFSQCFVLLHVSLVLPCGCGGQLWSWDNHLIITIAERRIVVIFDWPNKEVYVNSPNECTSSVSSRLLSKSMQSRSTHSCSRTFSSFLLIVKEDQR